MDDAMERKRIQTEMIEELKRIHRRLGIQIKGMETDKPEDTQYWLRMTVMSLVSSSDCLKEDLHLLNYLKFRLNTTERKDEQNAGNCCGEDYPCESERIPEEEH